MIYRLCKKLLELRNCHLFIIDTVIFLITPLLALALRLDSFVPLKAYASVLAVATVLFLSVKLSVFLLLGFYRRYWRYASIDELTQIVTLTAIAVVVQTLLFNILYSLNSFSVDRLPLSLPLLDGLLSFLLVGGLRFSVRDLAIVNQQRHKKFQRHERVLIVGAGDAGVALVKEMQQSPWLGFHPIAFIDDNPEKLSLLIRGLPVVGNRDNIPQFVRSLNIRRVIIAMPTAPGRVIREITDSCQSIGVQTSTLPGIHEILNGRVHLGRVRDIKIEDLLRRAPIHTDIDRVSAFLKGKTVLITGAGGSIGSELCRQVFKCRPAKIVLLGHGENSVFNIQQELEQILQSQKHEANSEETTLPLVTLIADIRFSSRLKYVFEQYKPDVVFHAAAHKHVPMMEFNPSEAITNNVRGTKNLLDLALQYGVERFVMISTDKAVNPTSVMGASKRVAEMLVLQAAQKSKKPFSVVRFGNVLGSRGSVVPTFRRQIAAGGPVTITHPDICRYFITIPEAVQLVLQASVLGQHGEVFMLNMGQPIKIAEMAKNLIRLSGYEVGKDIDIVYTGLRPGEKLFEELFIPGEKYEPTEHDQILTVHNASSIVPKTLDLNVEALCQAAANNDSQLIAVLLEQIVPGYTSPSYLQETPQFEASKERETLVAEPEVQVMDSYKRYRVVHP